MNGRDDERIVDEAAHWMMRLQSGQVDEADLRAFEHWQASDARHAQVFQRLGDSLEPLRQPALRGLRDEQLIAALNTPSSRRRFLQGSLGVLALLGGSALGLRLASHGLALPGDLVTATAERKGFELADGSRLTLDARSRVTPLFGGRERTLELHHGALSLEVAEADSPMFLQTPFARLEMPGGSHLLLESRPAGPARLTVLAAGASLETADSRVSWVAPGQHASFAAAGLLALRKSQLGDGAWLDGRLEVDDRSLGEVAEALRAYRHGVLRISPEAAALRVSGVFPLDDSSRALNLLEGSLPIRITRYSPYWVSIERLSNS